MAKTNGAMWKTVAAMIVSLVVVALGVAAGYGALRYQVNDVEETADAALKKADSNENSIIEIKTNLNHIMAGQTKQQELLTDIHKELKKTP